MKIFITQIYTKSFRSRETWEYRRDFECIDHSCSLIKKKIAGYFIESEERCPYCHEHCPSFVLLAANLNVDTVI